MSKIKILAAHLLLVFALVAFAGCSTGSLKAAKIKDIGWESENLNIHFSVFKDSPRIHGYLVDDKGKQHDLLVHFGRAKQLRFIFKDYYDTTQMVVLEGGSFGFYAKDKEGTIVNSVQSKILGKTYKKGEIVFKKVPVKPELDLGEWPVK